MDFIWSTESFWLVFRILVAAGFGGILGLEREIHGRAAGFRTHLLVSAGAALFMILSTNIATFGVNVSPGFTRITDPGRIAAQIVTGIGFLGAGVILKEGLTVRGLTTAACLWIAAAVGMAAGAGLYLIGALTTLIALFALVVLRHLERIHKRDIFRDLEVRAANDTDIRQIIDIVKSKEVMLMNFSVERDYETGATTARMSLRLFYKGNADKLVHNIVEKLEKSSIPLKAVKWEKP